MRQENVDLGDEIEKLRQEMRALKEKERSNSRIGQGTLGAKRKQLINLRPTSVMNDDNEEFQNIENQIKQSIDHIANIGNGLKEAGGLTALKKSSRHFSMMSYRSEDKTPNVITEHSENTNIEPIDEQAREESPTKSERN